MAKKTLNVTVTYPAVGKPFQDKGASSDETLASLKARVLKAFGLVEGEDGGSQVTYVLFKGRERLTDLSMSLGSLAGEAKALSLKLVQQIDQGA